MKESTEYQSLKARYEAFKARGLKLDMSRGKPSPAQLDLCQPMMTPITDYLSEDGVDTRNYGDPTGIPEAKRLFSEILDMPADQIIVGGNSSLNMMHDAFTRAIINGPLEGDTPWGRLDNVKIICPVPGYDWHFHILETLGLIPVPVDTEPDGPDLEKIRELVRDPSVKGFLGVPMYGNPTGYTWSDETVEALASMETAAPDFRIFWDNAYCVHHLYPDHPDRIANLYDRCAAYGHENRPLIFTSTSKITIAGGGISCMAASPENIRRQAALMMYQLVCYDKVNMLRHTRFLPDLEAVKRHMARQADIIRPKFEAVLEVLERELSDIAHWTKPNGGYFICFYAPKNCAKRVVNLCAEAGVTLTPAGSPYPNGDDKNDSVIRIAPTYPPIEELRQVMELFPVAVRMAYLETLA